MKDSTEKSKKQLDDETDLRSFCPVSLPVCDPIFQTFIAILRCFGCYHNERPYRPTPSQEDCDTAGSNPPSTAVDPPGYEYEEEGEDYSHHVPRPPPWSTGGGGQTNKLLS